MNTHSPPSDKLAAAATDERQHWLAVLAHAPRDGLQQHAQALDALPFDTLRPPEIGLAMLRGRIGNGGDRFNLGEATITRCVVRHRDAAATAEDDGENDAENNGGGAVSVGVGYVLGRDPERAAWVARFDALLQQPRWQQRLQREVIAPLAAQTAQRRSAEQRETAASRVHFFNLL